MDQKYLEICFSQGLTTIKFEIVEVRKHHFALKTKDFHAEFLETLDNWLLTNWKMREPGYSAIL